MKRYTLLLTACICFAACNNNQTDTYEYVYCDQNNNLHINSNCSSINDFSSIHAYRIDDLSNATYRSTRSWTPCFDCMSEDVAKDIFSHISKYLEEYQMREKQFDALYLIGEKRWKNVDEYIDYINIKENENNLEYELKSEGWSGGVNHLTLTNMEVTRMDVLLKTFKMEKLNAYKDTLYTSLYWDEFNIEKLYLQMCSKNINTGSLKDFKQCLKNIDDCVWICKKAIELELVNSWEQFFIELFECDCDDEF